MTLPRQAKLSKQQRVPLFFAYQIHYAIYCLFRIPIIGIPTPPTEIKEYYQKVLRQEIKNQKFDIKKPVLE